MKHAICQEDSAEINDRKPIRTPVRTNAVSCINYAQYLTYKQKMSPHDSMSLPGYMKVK